MHHAGLTQGHRGAHPTPRHGVSLHGLRVGGLWGGLTPSSSVAGPCARSRSVSFPLATLPSHGDLLLRVLCPIMSAPGGRAQAGPGTAGPHPGQHPAPAPQGEPCMGWGCSQTVRVSGTPLGGMHPVTGRSWVPKTAHTGQGSTSRCWNPPERSPHGCHAGVPQDRGYTQGGGAGQGCTWRVLGPGGLLVAVRGLQGRRITGTGHPTGSPRARAGGPPQLTKSLFGLHQAEGEGLSPGQLPQHPRHLVVPAAHDGLVVDGLDAVAHTHCLDAVDDAPLLDSLGTGTGDTQQQGGTTGRTGRRSPHPIPT